LIEPPARDGRVLAVNKRRLAEMPYFLLTNPPRNIVAIPANQGSPMNIMMVSGEGPAQLVSFGHEKLDAMRVFLQIQDGQMMRGLMNGSVHIDTIMGNGQQPYRLPEALYLDELRSLQITFTDISGVDNEVRVSALASRFLAQQVDPAMERIRNRLNNRQYMSTPYWYTLDEGPVTIPAGTTITPQITIGQDSHFQLFQMSVVSDGLFDIDIVDTQRGESIISGPLDVHYPIGSELILGNGNFPYRFHEPRLFQIGQRLVVTLTDRSGADNTVHLTLGGRAVAVRMWR